MKYFTALLARGIIVLFALVLLGEEMALCQGSDAEKETPISNGRKPGIFQLLNSRELGNRPPIAILSEALAERDATIVAQGQWATANRSTRICLQILVDTVFRWARYGRERVAPPEGLPTPAFIEMRIGSLPLFQCEATALFARSMGQTLNSLRQEMVHKGLEPTTEMLEFLPEGEAPEYRARTGIYLRYANVMSIHLGRLMRDLLVDLSKEPAIATATEVPAEFRHILPNLHATEEQLLNMMEQWGGIPIDAIPAILSQLGMG